jgi:CDP-paratose 2-epimerase
MYGLPGVVFRMSCIYGRRQLGTEDQGWVAHFALQMLRDGPLTLYGDGRQVRDILYVDDLLDAMLLAMEHLPAVAGKAFNIGGGPDNAVSLLEVIEQLSQLSGVRPEIRYGPRRSDGPLRRTSSILVLRLDAAGLNQRLRAVSASPWMSVTKMNGQGVGF